MSSAMLTRHDPAALRRRGLAPALARALACVGGIVVTSSITNAAVDELKLAPGKNAYAVIKASDVMVGID